jgi:hypothetical protein
VRCWLEVIEWLGKEASSELKGIVDRITIHINKFTSLIT